MRKPLNFELKCMFPNCWADVKTSEHFCEKHSRFRAIEHDLFAEEDDGIVDFYRPLTAVYVIGSEKVGAIKIGFAGDVLSRLVAIQTGFPLPLKLFSATYTSRRLAEKLEAKCHAVLRDFDMHLNGEWFDADPNDACELVMKCADLIDAPVLTSGEYATMLALSSRTPIRDRRMIDRVCERVQRDFVRELLDTGS